jgi:hypothetical protein
MTYANSGVVVAEIAFPPIGLGATKPTTEQYKRAVKSLAFERKLISQRLYEAWAWHSSRANFRKSETRELQC